MKRVVFHPEAAREAREAAAWYAGIRPELAVGFHAELLLALSRIQQNPQLYAAESDQIRVAPLNRFPYLVMYEELPDCVWIAAIGHVRRRPQYWAGRRPQ